MSSPPVFGWSPSPQDEGGVAPGRIITFNIDLDTSSRGPPSPKDSDDAVSDAGRPVRRGDPDWVPRPRNAFILFRSQYARLNARRPQSRSSKSKRGPAADRTMSKRAGEAWKALSKSARAHFKDLAEQEKANHARAHPGYRYRPAKRNYYRGNRVTYHTHQRSMPVQQPPSHPPRRISEVQPAHSSQVYGTTVFRRRSNSAPLAKTSLPPLLLAPEERLAMRRTRSLTNNSAPFSWPPSSPVQSDYELVYPPIEENPEDESALDSRTTRSAAFYSSYTVSPTAAISSSLAGWNGEPTAPPVERNPSSTFSDKSSSSAWSSPDAIHPQLEGYQYITCNADVFREQPYASTSTFASTSGMSSLAPPAVYWGLQADDASAGAGTSASAEYNPDSDGLTRANALASYDAGLATRVVSTPGECMPFDMPAADEQQIYEGFHF